MPLVYLWYRTITHMFRETRRHLGDIYWLSVGFDDMLYNNAAKIFGTEDVLCRRLEILKVIWIYKASGKC